MVDDEEVVSLMRGGMSCAAAAKALGTTVSKARAAYQRHRETTGEDVTVRPGSNKRTELTKTEIVAVAMVLEGTPKARVAKACGLSRSGLQNALLRAGHVEPRNDHNTRAIKALKESGLSVREIARRAEMSKSGVEHVLKHA